MCGIAGALGGGPGRADAAVAMAGALVHRGPDAGGHWCDDDAGVALAHRRLSILDLSEAGAQPMTSASGRYVVTYNGEVYNYQRLAAELTPRGHRLRGHSDTEVILAAIEEWGVEEAARRFVGIFAFGVWDRAERTLSLVRDHLGVKPLYYGWVGDTLVFGSELKALARYPGFRGDIDRDAVTLLLRFNCIPAPHSIYRGVRKLLPGHVLRVPAGSTPGEAAPKAFWSARDVVQAGGDAPLQLDDAEAVERLDALLRDAVKMQMASDVPLGAFLSGGVDSSLVVALMQQQSSRPVRTFTIGFEEARYDEATYAREVAAHLGTDHTEWYVSADDAIATLRELPTHYDEPFADSSQIPTLLVSRLAKQHVTVSLSGDGGDELFAGYNRHVLGERLWRRLRPIPRPMRQLAARAITAVRPDVWERSIAATGLLRSRQISSKRIGANLHKLAEVLGVADADGVYTQLVSHWKDPERVVIGGSEPPSLIRDEGAWARTRSFTERMMYLDLVTYLPDDILVKVDRASMAVGLEARVPLLDPRVVEFAWQLPLHQKLRDGRGKWALREVLYRYVPRAMIDRPKWGFGVPIDEWLRGPLRDWAEALLDPRRLRDDGFFDVARVRALFDAHQSRRADWQYHLWDVLMFQAWYHDGGRAA
jgi:asparagine synthase (glutamine-hydrolysing)